MGHTLREPCDSRICEDHNRCKSRESSFSTRNQSKYKHCASFLNYFMLFYVVILDLLSRYTCTCSFLFSFVVAYSGKHRYLQKSYSDSTFSYVVYAPINASTLWTILSGGDSDLVKFMASGFTIFPNRPVLPGEESSGSLLTVMFHILDDVPREDHSFLSLKSLDIMHGLISGTVKLIKDHTACDH